MKHFFLLIFLSMSLIAMDLDPELIEQEQALVYWKQKKIELQNAVENKDLNTVLSIFDEHFTKDSILFDYKKDAQKIVAAYVQEAIQEEYIIGFCTGYDVLKIADSFDFYTNDFLHLLEEIDMGVQWLRTGEHERAINKKQVLKSWNRIAQEYITHAIQHNDNDRINQILNTYAQSSNQKLKTYVAKLRRFTLHALTDTAQSIDPLTNTLQEEDFGEELHNSISESKRQEYVKYKTSGQSAECKQAQNNITNDEQPPIAYQSRVKPVTSPVAEKQTGTINWIQKHPFILGIGILTICSGVYVYFKNKKADKPKKKNKHGKQVVC